MNHPEEARRIRIALEESGLKATELAGRAGLSKSAISRYCNGEIVMSNKTAGRIGEILHVNPAWLMCFSDDKILYETISLEGFTPAQIEEIRKFAEFVKMRDSQ